jgi:hypothetical protein
MIDTKVKVEMLTEKELKLLRLVRDLQYGTFEVTVKEGQPLRAELIKQSIQF